MKPLRIIKELLHHLPYSAVGVAAALGLLLAGQKMGWKADFFEAVAGLHWMHGLHVFLGAVVSSALFWKNDRRVTPLLWVGILFPALTCTLSDMAVPYFGSLLFGGGPVFHIAFFHEPLVVWVPAFLGTIVGATLVRFVFRLTEIFHLGHVLISALASLLYLVSFSFSFWEAHAWLSFSITVFAVWIPCCLSDIVLPLAFTKGRGIPCCGHHPHDY